MSWSGAKNKVYRRLISLMAERMENGTPGAEKPVNRFQMSPFGIPLLSSV